MTSRKWWIAGFVAACMVLECRITAAQTSNLEKALAYMPRQKDVEFETPKPAELAKCKVVADQKGKLNGWVVYGTSGQVLRKMYDTDGDGKLDQWRYFNHGIEVYRDIDTNRNEKINQSRWLNLGGSRWGIDSNEDGHIDQWKVLSAAEASKEAIRAMTAGDDAALQAIMITAEDLKTLGMNPQLATKLLESAADAGKKSKAIMAKSKALSPQSRWTRFDAQMPSMIPVDDEKAAADLQVYEYATANVETKDKSNLVLLGEMIRVGEVWKLTQVPLPIEGEVVSSSGVLMDPVVASANGANNQAPSQKVEKILTDLQDLEQRIMQPGQTAVQIKSLMAKRAVLLKEAVEFAETEDEKTLLMKQTVDIYAIATQMGKYPDGVKDLRAIESDLAKKSPKSSLLPYTIYRVMQAENFVNLQEADDDKEKQADVQKSWLKSLEEFVTKYPTADDADDAMFQLGQNEELQGRTKEAAEWYQRLIKERPKSESAPRAQGALRRLDLYGQVLALSGPGLNGGTVDVKAMRDKVVLVVFWASEFKPCEDDVPQLRALYQDNKAKGFEILGIALDFNKDTAVPFVKKNNISWPNIYQPSGENQPGGLSSPIATSFGIISLPTMFLVSKDGKVVSRNATLSEVKKDLPDLLK